MPPVRSKGGERTVKGIDLNDPTLVHRYQLFAIATYPFGRFTLQYGGDISTKNSYFENCRLTLRYSLTF